MCNAIREGDEMACSCGLRWDVDEADPHANVVKYPAGLKPRKSAELEVPQVNVGPVTTQDCIDSHTLYVEADFTSFEVDNNELAYIVVEQGLDVCKVCGEYEGGLTTMCKGKK